MTIPLIGWIGLGLPQAIKKKPSHSGNPDQDLRTFDRAQQELPKGPVGMKTSDRVCGQLRVSHQSSMAALAGHG